MAARYLAQEASGLRRGTLGYLFAVAAACSSGVSVFVKSPGVRAFADPVLYTTLKDGLVGLALLVPLCCSSGWRAEYRHLGLRTWAWLVALAVMTARMTLGTAMLLAFVVATGRWVPLTQASATQWQYVIVTGGLLLLFTVTTFTAIRRASVSAVLAIGSGAPIITMTLQFLASGTVQLAPTDVAGLALTVGAVGAIIALGIRHEPASTGECA